MKKFFAILFSAVGRYFNKLFLKAKVFLNKEIPVAISIVESLKFFVERPETASFVKLTNTGVDDAIHAKALDFLPKLLVQLKIANNCLSLATNDEIIQCALNHLKSLQPTDRYGYWLMISSHLSHYLADGKLSWAEIVTLVQSVKNPEINTSK